MKMLPCSNDLCKLTKPMNPFQLATTCLGLPFYNEGLTGLIVAFLAFCQKAIGVARGWA